MLSHEGGAAASVFAAPRKREGRSEEASMVGEKREGDARVGDRGDPEKKGVQEIRGWTFPIKPWTGRGQKWAAGGEEGGEIYGLERRESALGTGFETGGATTGERKLDKEEGPL